MEKNEFRLYSKSEAMKLLGIGKDAFNQLISGGQISVIKLNKREKIPYSELKRFIEDNTIKKISSKPKEDINSFINETKRNSYLKNSIINNQIFQQLLSEASHGKYIQ